MKDGAKMLPKKTQPWMFILIMLTIVAFVPMYKQGIMCNDELQTRFWSSCGFAEFIEHYFSFKLQGRALQAPVLPLMMWLGLITQNNMVFRLAQIATIILCILTFTCLTYKVFANKKLSILCCVMLITFLPVSFEPVAPNAYVTDYGIPLLLMMYSMLMYIDFLRQNCTWKLVVSMIMMIITMCSYEAFVPYTLVYAVIYINENRKQGLRIRIGLKSLIPQALACVVVVGYVILAKVLPSDYSGNHVGDVSVMRSAALLLNFTCSAFPGFYLTSSKYQYLLSMYNFFTTEEMMRIVIAGLLFAWCLWKCTKKDNASVERARKTIGVSFTLLIVTALPFLPYTIAQGYQDAFTSDGMLAVPATFFSFFPATLLCSFVVLRSFDMVKRRSVKKLLQGMMVIVLTVCACSVQHMNGSFAEEQSKNYKRLTTIETTILSTLKDDKYTGKYYSQDLYETHNALAIHEGYWSQYAASKGVNIAISGTEKQEGHLIFIEDGKVSVVTNNLICLVSTEKMQGMGTIKVSDSEYTTAEFDDCYINSRGMYEYYYAIWKDKAVSIDRNNYLYVLAQKDGETSYIPVNNAWFDGWVGQEAELYVSSQKNCCVKFALTNLSLINQGDYIAIYVNDELYERRNVTQNTESFEIDTNEYPTIKVETNITYESTEDSRHLALLLTDFCFE